MATGIGMMLKAFGVNISEEHIKMVEREVPLLPSRIQEASQAIASALANFDHRIKELEVSNQIIIQNQQGIQDTLRLILEESRNGTHGSNGKRTTAIGRARN